jgi:hypothetical protein
VRTKIYIILFFLFIAISVYAQKNFVVYHVAGNVNTITNNKAAAAKRGDIITKNNSLQVKQGANCMLIEEKGRSLQVITAGTYTFEALQKMMLNIGKAGVTQKFFSYVYDNLFEKHGEKLSVTPVVFRGDELMKTPFDNTIIISDAFTVTWKKPAGKIPVRLFVVSDKAGEVMDTVVRNATSLIVDIAKNNFLPGTVYKWKAEEFGTRQPKEKYFYFLIAEKKDRKEILKEIKGLQDRKLTNELRQQLQQDIFKKWEEFYSKAN